MTRKSTSAILLDLVRPFARVVSVFLVLLSAVAVWRYPYNWDPAPKARVAVSGRSYYERVYSAAVPAKTDSAPTVDDAASKVSEGYERLALKAAKEAGIEEGIRQFVGQFALERSKVLEIGAGRGHLQDVVDDYTGLDIAESSRRFFHKKFVQASATDMPFADNSFDAAFSVWVLEHVPNPERALEEARRVVKDGGLLLMLPAFDCGEWFAAGYQVRPYADFGWTGKAYKGALPFIKIAIGFSAPLVRLARTAEWWAHPGPTRYRYRLLEPNYSEYWQTDGDALNQLDYFETAAWFTSRGDECLNCPGFVQRLTTVGGGALIVRVHKSGSSQAVASQR